MPRPTFDGDETKYEIWETKMLGYLHLNGLKDTVLREPTSERDIAADAGKNADAYAELILLLDDKSLSLVMRDAPNEGRKALKILRVLCREGKAPYNQLVHHVNIASEGKP